MKRTWIIGVLFSLVVVCQGCETLIQNIYKDDTLIEAAREGNTKTIKTLWGKGANVNVKDNNGMTALIWASRFGRTDTVKFLLDKGADVNAKDRYSGTALMEAARIGHTNIVHLLLDNGANVNEKDRSGNTALSFASDYNRTNTIQALIERGADNDSITPLMEASNNGDIATVRALIDNGANVNVKGYGGLTALHWVVSSGHKDIVQALLDHGADVNLRDNPGNTVLMKAVRRGDANIVESLLNKSADVNARTYYDNSTALMLAESKGHDEIVELLKKAGAVIDSPELVLKLKESEEYLSRGISHHNKKQFIEAMKAYAMATVVNPNNAFAHSSLAMVYFLGGQNDEFVKSLEKAISLMPELIKGSGTILGMAYYDLGRYDKAIEASKVAIKFGQNAVGYYMLGKTYNAMEQYNKAIQYLEKAIRLKPDTENAHTTLGKIYYDLKEYDVAIETLKEAIRLKPDDVEAFFFLGGCYFDKNQKTIAADYIYKAGSLLLDQNDRERALAVYSALKLCDSKSLEQKLFVRLYPEGRVVESSAEQIKERKKPRDLLADIEPLPKQTLSISGQRWAVIIGISTYQDTRIPALRYASADAKGFYDWIVSPEGGKYAPARVKLLIDQDATGSNIKNALFTWLTQAIAEDIVTIYFAGHGSPNDPESPDNLFLYPYDTQYNNVAATGFPMWDIETALKRFIKAKKVIVIADACHAGGVGQPFDVATRGDRGVGGIANPISAGFQNLSMVGDGICVISASGDKQLSKEGKEWGGGHGVFTHFLLKGLKGEADFNKDQRVTLGELIPFLSEQVRRETRNTQSPTVAGQFDPALSIEK